MTPIPFDARANEWGPRFLGEVKLAQAATVQVPLLPFGANALVLGPSSWGFGAPTAIPIPIQWPRTIRVRTQPRSF